jgi:hypothetical protein
VTLFIGEECLQRQAYHPIKRVTEASIHEKGIKESK